MGTSGSDERTGLRLLGDVIRSWTRVIVGGRLLDLHQLGELARTRGRSLGDHVGQNTRIVTAWIDAVNSELPDRHQRIYHRLDGLLDDLFGPAGQPRLPDPRKEKR